MGVFNPMDVNAPANQRRQQLVQKLMSQYQGSTHALGALPQVRPAVSFAGTAGGGGGAPGFMSQLHGGGGMQGGATELAPGAHFLSGYSPGAGVPVINWADVFRGSGNGHGNVPGNGPGASVGAPGLSQAQGALPAAPVDVPQDAQATGQSMGDAVRQQTGPTPPPSQSVAPAAPSAPAASAAPAAPTGPNDLSQYPTTGPLGLTGKAAQQWYAFHFGQAGN